MFSELGRKTTANLRMEVGEVQDTVEVTSDAPTLETSTAWTCPQNMYQWKC